jgi:hypothetical protein
VLDNPNFINFSSPAVDFHAGADAAIRLSSPDLTWVNSGGGSFTSSTELLIELAGGEPGTEFDTLAVQGSAILDGTLNIDLLDGFNPELGETFDILTAAEGITIGNLTLTDDDFDYTLIEGNSSTLQVTAVPSPATLSMLGLGGLLLLPRRKRS